MEMPKVASLDRSLADRRRRQEDGTGPLVALLTDALALAPAVSAGMDRQTALFGHLPELDSMAVANVLTAIEDRFAIVIDDDEVTGEMFASVGALADFIAGKQAGR